LWRQNSSGRNTVDRSNAGMPKISYSRMKLCTQVCNEKLRDLVMIAIFCHFCQFSAKIFLKSWHQSPVATAQRIMVPVEFSFTLYIGRQMVHFNTKNPHLSILWRAFEWKMLVRFRTRAFEWKFLVYFMAIRSVLCTTVWYILWPFGKLSGHLVYFPVLVCCTEKNLATLPYTLLTRQNYEQKPRQNKYFFPFCLYICKLENAR
jgi:hypothetical protein